MGIKVCLIAAIVALAAGAYEVSTGVDNEINSAAPDLVLDYESNYAGLWNPDNVCRALIRFDIKPTEDDAAIKVSLYRRIVGNAVEVYEITEYWDSWVTWSTQPDTGAKAGGFEVLDRNIPPWMPDVYCVRVDRVPEYGWMFVSEDTPPTEIWSFESFYPPVLEMRNEKSGIEPSSFGVIKAAFR